MNIRITLFYNITLRILLLFFSLVNIVHAQQISQVKQYTTDHGLPHNIVYSVLQDSKGYIWIGTDDGLVRFDGKAFKTYRSADGLLSNYVIDIAENKDSTLWIGSWKGGVNYIKNDSIYTPKLDLPFFKIAYIEINDDKLLLSDLKYKNSSYTKSGNNEWKVDHNKDKSLLYIRKDSTLTYDKKLYKKHLKSSLYNHTYLTEDKSFLIYGSLPGVWRFVNDSTFTPFLPEIFQQDTIHHITQDIKKRYWAGGLGKIWIVDKQKKVIKLTKDLPKEQIYDIKITSTGTIYFLTTTLDGKSRGFYSYNKDTKKVVDLRKKLGITVLPSTLEVDQEDNVWLSTSSGGLYCISSSPFKKFDKNKGLDNVVVTRIHEDKFGNVYVGTVRGLYVYKGSNFVRQDLFQRKVAVEVSALLSDPQQHLLAMIQVDSEKLRGNYMFKLTDKLEFVKIHKFGFVKHSFFDSQHRYWTCQDAKVLTYTYNTKDMQTNVKGYYLAKDMLARQIFEYKNKHWLATNKGLYAVKEKSKSSQNTLEFLDTLNVAKGLISNHVNKVALGINGELWIGTKEGLSKWKNGKFTNYNTKDGLISDNCTHLLQDHHGFLWIGTPKGLSCFDGKKFINYNHHTGLIAPDVSALFLDSKKRLWIGSSLGVSMLDIQHPPKTVVPPNVYIEQFLVNGVLTNFDDLSSLKYHSSVRIRVNALAFTYPEGVTLQYRLNDGSWQKITSNLIDFNRLSNGAYTFEVRAKKFNSDWSSIQKITFKVNSPFWLTWWAIGLYNVLLVLAVYGLVRWRLQKLEREKRKLEVLVAKRTQELEQQKEEIVSQAEQLKEMDKIKSHFFSNISHEFRTPLTLIMGPAEKLRDTVKDKSSKGHAQSVLTNSKRLLKLINQLLDFSKLESGKMIIQPKAGKLNIFLKNILHSFELVAKQKQIQLELIENSTEIIHAFDHDKLEKVFFNLISNAIKFTPSNGRISITLTQEAETIIISVADTGIGIAENALPLIFDRFYQVDGSQTRAHEGTGIGLALVKELVELHRGTIEVTSTINQGTTFQIKLPLSADTLAASETQVIESESEANVQDYQLVDEVLLSPADRNKAVIEVTEGTKNTILVVEDNTDLRNFICSELTPTYQVLEASDGSEGIEQALQVIPDLIITDVMMPKTDGFELLSTLRNNPNTSHIPIIILSAKASFESKIKGLETGSDDYLTKPFSSKELLLRIRNMFDRREKLRALFLQSVSQPSITATPSQVAAPSIDETFIKKAMDIVEAQIINPEFDVSMFCSEMGMSQSSLFRKLKALTNLSTTEFIRSVKLKRAASLIKQKSGRIDEIAFQSGFNDISYFNRCFKKQFGVTPKEYQ